MTGIKNIIRKQTVRFQYNGQADGFALQKEVGDWCTHTLIPQLERQLEPYCSPQCHLVLDKLELSATVDGANWQEQIQQQVLAALQKELVQQQSTIDILATDQPSAFMDGHFINDAQQVAIDKPFANREGTFQRQLTDDVFPSEADGNNTDIAHTHPDKEAVRLAQKARIAKKQAALVFFFLQHGYLPWWSNTILAEPFAQWLPQWLTGSLSGDANQAQQVRNRVGYLVQQVKALASDTATDRLVQHLTGGHFMAFVQLAFPQAVTQLNHIHQLLAALPSLVSNRAKHHKLLQQINRHWLTEKLQSADTPNTHSWLQPLYQAIQSLQQPLHKRATPQDISYNIAAPEIPNNPMAQQWQQFLLQKQATQQMDRPTNLPATAKKTKPQSAEEKAAPASLPYQPSSGANKKATLASEIAGPVDSKSKPTAPKEKPVSPKPKAAIQAEWQEGIFINNAGAVIVAPFLPMLFATLKLAKNGVLQKPAKAAWLIQYLVTGSTAIGEADLVLPKILCGLAPDEVVNPQQKITALQKKEIQELLTSVIAHWSILKNTSPQGLQQSFLQRNGKLVSIDNEWLLQVEQKSYDMLLQQLPWNINMIKLPWMKNVLLTEWV